ncbi:pilus assembly protein TadG-related protein [Emcibacter sp. SYSU 3D8]|uniref:pilus assembly protein TadG-related protein n=1 Tax=Emcibacter sp. SYSU 3D8 TaxID=3133969 RepID=UPI0031FE72DB
MHDTSLSLGRHIVAAIRDRSGNIAIIVALCIPVLLASMALGFEITQWYMGERSMQNAADSAVTAAATNGGANYDVEARAVAAQYGYVNGVDNVTVAVTNTAPCPAGGNNCYRVSISKPVPLYLSQMVGFQGTSVINGTRMQNVGSAATATQATVERPYCLLTLAGLSGHSSTEGIRCNGCPMADYTGCNIMSNNTATCNGHTTLADIGDAHSNNNNCGVQPNSNMPQVADPYAVLASNIPADPCGGTYHYYVPRHGRDPEVPLPASNVWSGNKTVNGTVSICGDLQLSGNVNISNTTGDGGILIIWNGQLDTDGNTLQTTAGYLTIIFAGTNGASTHAPTGGGELNFSAPRTGVWKGMAIYQAPNLTSGVDISDAGNSPTWNITGIVYLPNASVTFSGAINKAATNGLSCFGMVVDNIRINGTGLILTACDQAGVVLPSSTVPGRAQLVH